MVEPPDGDVGVGSHLGDRYELLREIGRGGFGAVFEARDAPLNRSVAVKLIHTSWTEAGAELEREATLLAGIRSPHVVRVLDASVMEKPPYLVMELLEGASLRARLDRTGALDTGASFRVLAEVLKGLRALHERTLLHGDLKPENVILTGDGAKLIDLGISRPWTSPHERADHVLGTPAYLSPELLRGGRPDPRSDLYAAGLLLHEMLSGRPAHPHRDDLREITDEIREGRRAPLTLLCPWLPLEVSAFVGRALEAAVGDRFQSADEMLAALARLPESAVEQPPEPREAPTLGERFQLLRSLGTGSLRRVWEARDRQRDALVSVRRLELVSESARSAVRQLAGLRSPHVPQVYDLVPQDQARFVLVMERLPGRSLADVVGHALPLTTLAATAGQLLAGLAAAHEAGLVHGDLAPANVRISHVGQDSIVKLLGFRLGDEAAEPAYAAPEVTSGAAPTPRSDVYSAAAILFELLTGDGYDAAGRTLAAKEADLRVLGRVAATAPITRTLHRALAPDPAKRFADARAFLAATREATARES
jgi:serine/threonine protein kinase